VAAALAKLGVKVAFISALGHDDLALQMLDLLSGLCCINGSVLHVSMLQKCQLIIAYVQLRSPGC
jgi:hypothetical protein